MESEWKPRASARPRVRDLGDAPFPFTAKKFAETRDASIIWEGHKAGAEIGYCHMEKLSNLDALPSHGFKVACFPVKIEKASAGWTRAVAIIEN